MGRVLQQRHPPARPLGLPTPRDRPRPPRRRHRRPRPHRSTQPRHRARHPGETIETIPPFDAPPAAVIYLLRRDVAEGLAGWGEDYEIASGEDIDLAFKVWTNDLDIVYDSRVLVDHIGKGSASRLDDWQGLWARNRQHFLTKWQDPTTPIPRLPTCDPHRHHRNHQTARATAHWMARFFELRDLRQAAEPDGAVVDQDAVDDLRRLADDVGRADDGRLVRGPDGDVHLVEGGHRRSVRSGLLAAALQELLGPIDDVDDDALAELTETAPLDVVQVGDEPPVVVVGGRRRPVRNLPLPRPVSDLAVEDLEEGEAIDVARARAPQAPAAPAADAAASRAVDELRHHTAGTPELVRAADGAVHLVEAGRRRRIRSGLLAAALRQHLGRPRDVDDDELASWDETSPVDVLEAAEGPPFLVVGGRRLPLRGLPLPTHVDDDVVGTLPLGEELDVAAVTRSS